MNRFALAMLLIAGCVKPDSDPPPITQDASSVASGGAAEGAGGSAGAASSASAGGNGGGGGGGGAGSRLKAVSYVGSDGSVFPRSGAYDSLLGMHCAFDVASDGATRCIPSAQAREEIGPEIYIDDACARRAVEVSACQATHAQYVSVRSGNSSKCPPYVNVVYRIGAELSDVAYYVVDGECVQLPSRGWYRVEAAVVDPEELVRVDVSVEGQ